MNYGLHQALYRKYVSYTLYTNIFLSFLWQKINEKKTLVSGAFYISVVSDGFVH